MPFKAFHESRANWRCCAPLRSPAATVLLASLQIGLVTSSSSCLARADTPRMDVNTLVKQAATAVAADPVLEGAWLHVDAEDDGRGGQRAVFARTFDANRLTEQSAAMDGIIRRLVPGGEWRIDTARDLRLPYSRLVAGIRKAITSQPRFAGCELLGGTYSENTDNDSLSLVPGFRVAREGQFDALLDECRALMASDPAWSAAKIGLDDRGGDRQMVLVPEPSGPNENELVRAIAAAIQENPALRGAWLDVRLDDQGHPGVAPTIYVFQRTFDSERVGPQSAAMDALIRQVVPSGRFRIDTARDVMLPLSALLREINKIADLDPIFAGCVVSSASYQFNTDDDRWYLVPRGRVWQGAQKPQVVRLCKQVMNSQPEWGNRGVGVFENTAGELVVESPNPAVAAHYFSEAMHRFWKGDYGGADDTLALASLDAPDNVVYRYWRVISELADGNQGLAEERLRQTIDGFNLQRHSLAHHEIMQSIYRIQGPLRLALMRAEHKAMVTRTTRSNDQRLHAAN